MNLRQYHKVFTASSLVLMLIAAAPTLNLILAFPSATEPFSELWILDSDHKAENYPFNVRVNEPYNVFIGVGNHMGSSAYYLVYVKFRNQTQPLPDPTSLVPSPLPPLYEFRAFVAEGGTWEVPMTFRILQASRQGDSMVVTRISINDVAFDVDTSTDGDSEDGGFYYQLFFELWLYNNTSENFQFRGRFVGIWLNITA